MNTIQIEKRIGDRLVEEYTGNGTSISTEKQMIIRKIITSFYYMQKLRMTQYARIVALVRDINGFSKIDEEEGKIKKADDKMTKEMEDHISKIFNEYKDIKEEISHFSSKKKIKFFEKKEGGAIDNIMLYSLVDQFTKLKEDEDEIGKIISYYLKDIPIYEEYLKNVKGCGPIMAAVIVSYFDIRKSKHVSSFWKYAGLDVVINDDGTGLARSKREDHLITRQYVDHNGKLNETKSITFNQFLRAKLLHVLGKSLITHNREYKKIYTEYKYRITQIHPDYTKMHIHNMSLRYMVKMFVKELWNKWRVIEGFEVELDWAEHYLRNEVAHGESKRIFAHTMSKYETGIDNDNEQIEVHEETRAL